MHDVMVADPGRSRKSLYMAAKKSMSDRANTANHSHLLSFQKL